MPNPIATTKDTIQCQGPQGSVDCCGLVANAPVGIFTATLEGRFRSANLAMSRLYGYDSPQALMDEVQNIGLLYANPSDHTHLTQQRINQDTPETFESLHRRRDGTFFWTYQSAHPVRNTSGEILYIQFFITDISTRKEAERTIAASEKKLAGALSELSMIYQNAPVALLVLDRNRRIKSVNGAAVQLAGRDSHDIMTGMTTGQALRCMAVLADHQGCESDAKCQSCVLRKTILDTFEDKQGRQGVEGRLSFPSGSGVVERYLQISTNHLMLNDEEHVIVLLRDITEQRALEDRFLQAQKMESVGRLAGGLAHDFNNILQAILGNVDLAASGTITDDLVNESLTEIRKCVSRASGLIRQLLAFARKQTIAPKILSLNDKVDGTLKMLRHLIGQDVRLKWLPGVDLWPVEMDPSQIDQILANLCVNARDAIPGVGTITIETNNVTLHEYSFPDHAGPVSGGYVLLSVRDDGCGMDVETLDKAFEPFFTTKPVGVGTGLGLSTVYGIVKQNSGLIEVFSKPQRGTTINIYFRPHTITPDGVIVSTAVLPAAHLQTVPAARELDVPTVGAHERNG